MAKDLRGIFEEEGAHLKFDRVLAKKIEQYGISFVCKTKDHMEFFGGHLTGVQIIRFTPADSDKWFEILELNDLTIEEKLLDLPSINDKWNVAKNAFNETCIWLMHKFMTSEHLNEHERHDAAVNVSLVLHYRFITGLLVHYFKYPTDKETAEAVYARLSNKFLLKQYGSWSALLRARSEDIVGEHSIHHRTLMEYNSDKSIIDALNDIQGRLRDVWKNLYEVLVQTRHSGTKMTTISSMVELDGESILKDKTKNLSAYNRYLHSIITDRDSFIKEELLEVVCNLMHTMPKPYLVATLEWCSSNYSHGGNKEVDDLINLTLVHSFGYLSDNRTLLKHNTDLTGLISRLRGVWMSARSTNPELLQLRELAQKIVKRATGSRNESTIAAVRTGLLAYIVLRAYSMRYYSGA